MKKIILILIFLLFSKTAFAEELGSIYVWYAGDNSFGSPPNQLISDGLFNSGNEKITQVTIKGYGEMVKRLRIVFFDKQGNMGYTLVKKSKLRPDKNGFITYTYKVTNPNRWSVVRLEYLVYNFRPQNRRYNKPALFWIEKVTTNKGIYIFEPPSDEDDILP